MRLTQKPPRRDQELSLIPLINVVFLLLIFFMLAGTLGPTDPLPIDPPVSQQARRTERDAPQLLIDAEGRVALDGIVLDASQVADRLGERIAQYRRQVAAGADGPPLRLLVKADGAVVSSQLRSLLAQLRLLGVEQVQLLVRQD